jgi:hypothetical protein
VGAERQSAADQTTVESATLLEQNNECHDL